MPERPCTGWLYSRLGSGLFQKSPLVHQRSNAPDGLLQVGALLEEIEGPMPYADDYAKWTPRVDARPVKQFPKFPGHQSFRMGGAADLQPTLRRRVEDTHRAIKLVQNEFLGVNCAVLLSPVSLPLNRELNAGMIHWDASSWWMRPMRCEPTSAP